MAMKFAVIDTGVLIGGIFWRNEPHRVLQAWLHGLLRPVVTKQIMEEYERILHRFQQEHDFDVDPEPWLERMRDSARWVEPVSFRQRVCRDAKDDKFIEAALAAGVNVIIARDPDLTVLEKPFGISILTPRAWLATLTRAERRKLE